LVSKLKAAGVKQAHIAARAKVSQGLVSKVIGREARDTAPVERVWREIERILADERAS
jgi:hypothetical protein